MYRNSFSSADKRSTPPMLMQRGFSIVSAIFLLVVLSVLGAAMAMFSMTQSITSVQDIDGARAYQAARAGIEWSLYQILRTGTDGTAGCTASNVTANPGTLAAGTLSTFGLTLACTASGPYVEGSRTFRVFTITSTAAKGTQGTPGRIERQLVVSVER